MSDVPTQLTAARLARAVAQLARRDPDLARIRAEYGPPPLWARPPGFPTLLHIILEQQVSLASARAAFTRLCAVAVPLTPQRFLALDDATLRAVGFSRQKLNYGRGLAAAIQAGTLDLDYLATRPDAEVQAALVQVKGIGAWTADIYLLMALGRPDAWPGGDLGLAIAVQEVKRWPQRPTFAELETISAQWRPWRAVAARLLWHYYLSRPKPAHVSAAARRG